MNVTDQDKKELKETEKDMEHVKTPEELVQEAMALRDQAKTAVEAFGIEWPFEDR